MKQFDEHFSEQVRQVFDRYDEAVDEQAWTAMKARLEKKRPLYVVPLVRTLSAVAAVLLLLVVFHFVFRSDLRIDQPAHFASMPSLLSPLPAVVEHDAVFDAPLHRTIMQKRFITAAIEADTTGLLMLADEMATQLSDFVVMPAQGVMATDSVAHEHSVEHLAGIAGFYTNDPEQLTPPAIMHPGREGALSWSVTAGPVLTWAEDQLATGVGYGIGVLADYHLTENISLSSGVLFSHRQFELNQVLVSEFTVVDQFNTENFYEIAVYGDYQIEHLTFDIPVNVRFNLPGRPGRQFFATAGFSSLLYVSQNFSGTHTLHTQTYQISQGSVALTASDVFSRAAESPQGRHYNIAGLINLAIGYELPLDRHAFFLEPFIQYPLGELSPHQLRMGMGGLRLRLLLSGK